MRLRAVTIIALAAALLLGTAGCGVLLEPATLKSYSPSDGVNADIGDVKVRNALVVTNDNGDGALVMTLVNNSESLVFVTVELRGEVNLSTSVGAYPGTNKVGIADGNPLVFPNAGIVAGSYAEVYFQYGNNEGVLATVPVVDGASAVYVPYAPPHSETE